MANGPSPLLTISGQKVGKPENEATPQVQSINQ